MVVALGAGVGHAQVNCSPRCVRNTYNKGGLHPMKPVPGGFGLVLENPWGGYYRGSVKY